MADARWPLQKAIYAALDAALATPIYDHVPPAATLPYITIGDDATTEWSDKSSEGQEITVGIHVWDEAHRGHKAVKELLASIYAVLHRQPLVVVGYSVVDIACEFSQTMMDLDGLTYHGISRYRVLIY